jgi:tetratricopeptide (TPR) repeat protein
LGLDATATEPDVDLAYEQLTDFLRLAPPELRAWAGARLAEVDEAYTLLAEPGLGGDPAEDGESDTSASDRDPAERSGKAARRSRPGGPSTATEPGPPAMTAPAAAPRQRALWVAIAALATAGIVFGVRGLGDSAVPEMGGQAMAQSSASPSATIDQMQVMQLMQRISTNPRDVAALAELADVYFQAGDYQTASNWQRKVLEIDPKNELAQLGLGAAQFNLGNLDEAEQLWLAVVKANPRQIEAHYDLGFLYMKKDPPEPDKMQAEWAKVVQLDPDSDYAKSISQHMPQATSSSAGSGATSAPTSSSPAPTGQG